MQRARRSAGTRASATRKITSTPCRCSSRIPLFRSTARCWADVEIGWEMRGNRLTVTVNGDSHTFTLLPGSEGPGYYLGLGNMDPITDEIDFDDIDMVPGDPPDPPDPPRHESIYDSI